MSFLRIDSVTDSEERAFLSTLHFSDTKISGAWEKTRFGWIAPGEFGKFAGFYTTKRLEDAPFYSGLDPVDGCIYRYYKDGRKQLMVDADGHEITPANVFLEY